MTSLQPDVYYVHVTAKGVTEEIQIQKGVVEFYYNLKIDKQQRRRGTQVPRLFYVLQKKVYLTDYLACYEIEKCLIFSDLFLVSSGLWAKP